MYRETLPAEWAGGRTLASAVPNRASSTVSYPTAVLPSGPGEEKYADDQNCDEQHIQSDGAEQHAVEGRVQQIFALPDPLMKEHKRFPPLLF
jgi:hypothetical protein